MKELALTDWVFTDPHFNHHRLVEWGDRPEGFETLIADSWQRRVGQNDTVYCLGDVCFKSPGEAHETYIKPMPGYKILILGNHDKQKEAWYLSHGWNEVHTEVMLKADVGGRHTRLLLSHIPQSDAGNRFDLNLHGHYHNNYHRIKQSEEARQFMLSKKHILLSIEEVNYDFVRLFDLINGRVEQPGLALLREGLTSNEDGPNGR